MSTSPSVVAPHDSTIPTPALASSQEATRYHAFDCVRAMAMLLGVFYHWQYVGGGSGMFSSPKASIDHWLHSFRMALFFLISGFFANMVLGKYGLWKYLRRRWWRIGAPLLVAIFAFAGLTFIQQYFTWAAPPNPFAANFGGFGQGFGGPPGGGGPQGGAMWPGFGGPPAGGAGPGGGGAANLGSPFAPPGGPGTMTMPAMGTVGGFPGPFTPTTRPATPRPATVPAQAATPPAPPPMPAMFGPPPQNNRWIDRILNTLHLEFTRADGRKVRIGANFFQLQHLWFLWYLLIFVTIAPLVAIPLRWLLLRKDACRLDPAGLWLVRWNLAPLLLALITLPALMHARGFDWTLTNPLGFSTVFPDCLVTYCADQPFYFLYFLFGWWFFRLRGGLAHVARPWLFNLVLGIAAFAVSQSLYDHYGPPPMFPFFGFGMTPPAPRTPVAHPEAIRLLAFACYSVGAAYSGFGLLGLFQKFFDRPTKLGRYFTDTMLWVYLVQLALIPYLASWVDYANTSWWEATLGGVLLVTTVALVLFELFVRPTPLVHIFGPASLSRRTGKSDAAGGPS